MKNQQHISFFQSSRFFLPPTAKLNQLSSFSFKKTKEKTLFSLNEGRCNSSENKVFLVFPHDDALENISKNEKFYLLQASPSPSLLLRTTSPIVCHQIQKVTSLPHFFTKNSSFPRTPCVSLLEHISVRVGKSLGKHFHSLTSFPRVLFEATTTFKQ